MDFEFSKEQLEVKARARLYLDEVVAPLEVDWPANDYDAPEETTKMLVAKFREYGLRGMAVPKECGGQGLGTMAKVLVYEELAKSPVTRGLLQTWSGFLDPNSALFDAPEWQKEKYLYPILKDDKFYHIHISEPGVGSDAAAIQTRAVRDGDNFIINGRKRWAPPPNHWAITPSYLLCYAVTDPDAGYKGVSAFLVDYPTEGLYISPGGEKSTYEEGGYIGRVTTDYVYDNVVVPAKNMMGKEGNGFRYMMDQLNRNRIVISAQLMSKAEVALDMMIKRAKERECFGKPISQYQAIQWMIAESAMEIESAKLLVYKAAMMMDAGKDVRKEAAMCKCQCPVIAQNVIDRAIQVYGGLGMLPETGLGRMWWQARSSRVAEGTTEIMKRIVAKELLK